MNARKAAMAALLLAAAVTVQASPALATCGPIRKAAILPWFGYGLYNHKTACGERLTKDLIGVASRTLPCGQWMTITWHGHTIQARVVDRGPYPPRSQRHAMPLDLTAGAAHALGGPAKGYFTRRHATYRTWDWVDGTYNC
jgi:rare lipoprotein A (peptidoglycan hydrolase)